mgnify:FL=1
MQIITFDQDVIGIDLKKENGKMPVLVVLTGSHMDSFFKVNIISLKVVYTLNGK